MFTRIPSHHRSHCSQDKFLMGSVLCRIRRRRPSSDEIQETNPESLDNMKEKGQDESYHDSSPLIHAVKRPNQLPLTGFACRPKCMIETPTGNMTRVIGNTPSGIPLRFVDETPSSTSTPFHPSYFMPSMKSDKEKRQDNQTLEAIDTDHSQETDRNPIMDNNYNVIKEYLSKMYSEFTNSHQKNTVCNNNYPVSSPSIQIRLSPIVETKSESSDHFISHEQKMNGSVKAVSTVSHTLKQTNPLITFHQSHSQRNLMLAKQELYEIDFIEFRIKCLERSLKGKNSEAEFIILNSGENMGQRISSCGLSSRSLSSSQAKALIQERREYLEKRIDLEMNHNKSLKLLLLPQNDDDNKNCNLEGGEFGWNQMYRQNHANLSPRDEHRDHNHRSAHHDPLTPPSSSSSFSSLSSPDNDNDCHDHQVMNIQMKHEAKNYTESNVQLLEDQDVHSRINGLGEEEEEDNGDEEVVAESVTPSQIQELKEEVNDVKHLLVQLQSILSSVNTSDDHNQDNDDCLIDSTCSEKLNQLHARMIRLSLLENRLIN